MRAHTCSQLREMDFDTSEFNQPVRVGECSALLVMKQRGKVANITGFFITESGEGIKASVWRDKAYLGLDKIEIGTKLNLVFCEKSNGTVVLGSVRIARK